MFEIWLIPFRDEAKPPVRYLVNGEPVVYATREQADKSAKYLTKMSIHRYFSQALAETPSAPAATPPRRTKTSEHNTAAGIADGKQGAERAAEHVSDDWLHAAYRAGVRCACEHAEFTTDEIWQQLTDSEGKEWHPNGDSRAMGSVIRRLVQNNVIVPTGTYRPSARRSVHGSPAAVYRAKEQSRV